MKGKPDFITKDDDDVVAERLRRFEQNRRIAEYQKRQMEERKAEEERQLKEALSHTDNMYFLKDDDSW